MRHLTLSLQSVTIRYSDNHQMEYLLSRLLLDWQSNVLNLMPNSVAHLETRVVPYRSPTSHKLFPIESPAPQNTCQASIICVNNKHLLEVVSRPTVIHGTWLSLGFAALVNTRMTDQWLRSDGFASWPLLSCLTHWSQNPNGHQFTNAIFRNIFIKFFYCLDWNVIEIYS